MKRKIIFATALSLLLSGSVYAAETETETEAAEEQTFLNWNITLKENSFTDRIDGDFVYYEPDPGCQYLVVSASVTNTGKKAETFLPAIRFEDDPEVKLFYAEEYEYTPSYFMGFSDALNDSSINPLTTKDGIIAFPVPDLVVDSEEPLKIVFSAGEEKIEFELR